MTTSYRRPGYFTTLAVWILFLGFAVRVWNLGSASFWIDEALTHFRVQGSVSQTVDYLASNAAQGPFHYLFLHLFPRSDELQLRIVSVWIGMVGIALFVATIVRLFRSCDMALLAGVLLALNPYHVWLSRTARAYSLLFTLSLLSLLFFLLLLQGKRSLFNWMVFVLSSMAAYVTHHFALVLPLSQYLLFAFILRGNRGFFHRWIRAQLVAGIPLLVYTLHLMRQDTVAVGVEWIPKPDLRDIFFTLWNMLVGYEGMLYWYLVPGLIVGLTGLSMGVVYSWRNRHTDRIALYWLLMVLTTIGGAFAVSILVRPLFVDRYFAVSLPAILGLTVVGWYRWISRRATIITAVAFVLSSVISLLTVFGTGTYERENWRGAASYIDRERRETDGLLAESPDRLIALLYYLDNEIDYAWLEAGTSDSADLTFQFDTAVQRLWVVYRNPFDDGHRQNRMPDFDPFLSSESAMSEWLRQHHSAVLSQKEFSGVTLFLVDVSSEGFGVEP